MSCCHWLFKVVRHLVCACLLLPLLATAQPTFPSDPGHRLPIDPGERLNTTHIDASTVDPAAVLVQAIRAGRSVTLCGVDIDLSGVVDLALQAGQTLRARAGCERSSRNLGPRIRVTDARRANQVLFILRDSGVAISGFRLQGPTPGIGAGNAVKEFAIQVLPNPRATPYRAGISDDAGGQGHLLRDVEISNMEISQWSGGAVRVDDSPEFYARGRMTAANVQGVTVRNNHIHHNRHYDGYGYGVNVGNGAYALVQANVFEQNRHAIAGDSASSNNDYSGYTFSDNLVLPGGGLHCSEGFFNACWQTHQIDMHGSKSEKLLGAHCCGVAGETMLIERNTILYRGGYRPDPQQPSRQVWEDGLAIKIRGVPEDRVWVDANVFALASAAKAIAQNSDGGITNAQGQWVPNIPRPIQITANNRWGANPLAALGRCDFDGDGRMDDFMATGVTWWARSAFTQQWRYLSTKTEALRELVLGDFDGDGRCDVGIKPGTPAQAVSRYSSGGTGPWMTRSDQH
jgi:hypothetical protein